MPQAEIAALYDVGLCRDVNEDACLVTEFGGPGSTEGLLLGVFDGCGGFSSGRVASDMVADVVASTLRDLAPEQIRDDLGGHLERVIKKASDAIYAKSTNDRRCRGMGTTATVAAIQSDTLYLAHVGDSRAYILRRGRLVQISRDQTLLNHLIAKGKILPEEIEEFPHTGVIMYALGIGSVLEVDRTAVRLRCGDVLLLCTDGLWNLIDNAGIETVLRWHEESEAICKALVDAANAAGGHDNVTVVVAKFEDEMLMEASKGDEIEDRNQVEPRADAVSWQKSFEGG